jgi:hypothetical protein
MNDRDSNARVIADILSGHKGKGAEITGPEIAEMTGLKYEEVRHTISFMIRHRGKLVGSNTKGYYTPVTTEEIHEVTRGLRLRAMAILSRASKLMGSSMEDVFKQGRLEFEKNDLAAGNI